MINGEINFSNCGDEITVRVAKHISLVYIKIGKGFWIILSKEQVQKLKEKLEEENLNE